MEIGVPAQARVVTLGQDCILVDDKYTPILCFKLEVIPNPAANGQGPTAPYTVEVKQGVPVYATGRVQPGATISVRYDPADPKQVAIDFQAMGYKL